MKLYTIIVIYNGMHRQWIKKCIDSLMASEVPTTVIAVDNGSSDESCEFIQKNYPQVILIRTGENLGFGRANNIGLSYGLKNGGTHFFLLNQDAEVCPDTLGTLLRVGNENPEFGVLSPIQLNAEGTRLEPLFATSLSYPACKDLLSDLLVTREIMQVYKVEVSYAASWLITYECLKRVGGFNPSFYHYGEDDNYCQRVWYKGLKVGVVPLCTIRHDCETKPDASLQKDVMNKEKRKNIYLLSQPKDKVSFDSIVRSYQKRLAISLLTGRFSELTKTRIMIKFLQKKRAEIIYNRNLSVSGKTYPFLDYPTTECISR